MLLAHRALVITALLFSCSQEPETRVATQECLDQCTGFANYAADCGDDLWIVREDATQTIASPQEYCENNCTLVRYMLDASCESQHRAWSECIGDVDWSAVRCLGPDEYLTDLEETIGCADKGIAWQYCLYADFDY